MTEEQSSEKKEKEKKLPKRYVPCVVIGGTVYESVIFQLRSVFLSWDGKEFFRYQSIPFGDEELMPLKVEMCPYRPYILTMENFETIKTWNPTCQQIYDKVYKEFDTFLDLEKEFKSLNTAFTLETYEQHKVESTGYLIPYGDKDSGKTRCLEIHNLLDYRPLFSPALPSADVFNYIGYHTEGTGTILEDEAHELNRKDDREKLKIYRSGYRKGAVCPRIVDPSSKERTQRFYKTFCCKMFAGYYPPPDRGLTDRGIPIPMVWGIPEKDKITKEDRKRMDIIKMGLLVWRMRHYFDSLPEINIQLSGRTRELWESKIQVTHGLEHEKYLKALALRNVREKVKERAESLEGYITRALFKISAQTEVELEFTAIWVTLLDELGIPLEEHDKDVVECPALGYKVSKKAVGHRLGSVFGGEAFFRHKQGRTWKFKKWKLERLAKKFYIYDLDVLYGEGEIEEENLV